ncbi:MAG: Fe-S cluster assembly protein SufD [Steroidobacteraceae bacterium]
MTTALTTRIVEEHAALERALPARSAGAARRRAAMAALAASGLPTSRDENWRYANLRPLERLRFTPAPAAPAEGAPASLQAALAPALPGFARYVFVDGLFAPALSAPTRTPGAVLSPLAAAGDAAGTGRGAAAQLSPDERFALLNEAFATDGAAIVVSGSARLELVFVSSAEREAGASYPRAEVRLEPGATLDLIERHVSAGAQAGFVTSAVTVDVGRGATLRHYRLQELAERALMLDTLSAVVAEAGTYRLHGISSGAQAARSTLNVRLAGERAALALSVVALGDRTQVQDCYARVVHAAPRARTEQTFRGIAAGRARVAFNGKVVVASDATGSDSRQSLRGLLAGPEAEIDVRPQLEIYTDEVRCSHGATAGKLDDNMLFYLLSRGLDRDSARRVLKWAFLEDVIAQIELPELRRQVETRVASQLEDAQHLQELL